MAGWPEAFAGSLSPEMRKLLDGLDDLTGRLELAVGNFGDSVDSYPAPDPAEPAERDTDD